MMRGLDQGQREHGMREDGPGAATDDLVRYIGCGFTPQKSPAKRFDQGHGWIEVGTAHRTQQSDSGCCLFYPSFHP
jgi:hypothetical protein